MEAIKDKWDELVYYILTSNTIKQILDINKTNKVRQNIYTIQWKICLILFVVCFVIVWYECFDDGCLLE